MRRRILPALPAFLWAAPVRAADLDSTQAAHEAQKRLSAAGGGPVARQEEP